MGTLWFAIFLQLFLIIGVVYTLASDSIAMHRLQISVFGAIAIVFSVTGTNAGIFSGIPSLDAMGAGWLILAMVNIIWVLYFTSEQDSLVLHVFNMGGNGGLTPPSRRRTRTPANNMDMATTGGYATNYASGGGVSSADIPYDAKAGGMGLGMSAPAALRSQHSFAGGGGSTEGGGARRSFGGPSSLNNVPVGGGDRQSPLMASSPLGAPPSTNGGELSPGVPPESFMYKAKSLYNCEFHFPVRFLCWLQVNAHHFDIDSASPDDPNEISFQKGEILDIVDKQGKWWQAKKSDGTIGSETHSSRISFAAADPVPQLRRPIICRLSDPVYPYAYAHPIPLYIEAVLFLRKKSLHSHSNFCLF